MNETPRGPATSDASPAGPSDAALQRMRTTSTIAVWTGALGAIAFLLWAGRHNPSRIVLALMAVWVLSPFAALAVAHVPARRWSKLFQVTLYRATQLVTLVSLVVYLADALGQHRTRAAFVFVLTPPVAWAIVAIAFTAAALSSRSRSRDARVR